MTIFKSRNNNQKCEKKLNEKDKNFFSSQPPYTVFEMHSKKR